MCALWMGVEHFSVVSMYRISHRCQDTFTKMLYGRGSSKINGDMALPEENLIESSKVAELCFLPTWKSAVSNLAATIKNLFVTKKWNSPLLPCTMQPSNAPLLYMRNFSSIDKRTSETKRG